jgi:hypothetical protein
MFLVQPLLMLLPTLCAPAAATCVHLLQLPLAEQQIIPAAMLLEPVNRHGPAAGDRLAPTGSAVQRIDDEHQWQWALPVTGPVHDGMRHQQQRT